MTDDIREKAIGAALSCYMDTIQTYEDGPNETAFRAAIEAYEKAMWGLGAMNTERVKRAVQPDGSLYDLGWFLAWNPGDEQLTMDGPFSAADLRSIAAHMDRLQSSPKQEADDPA